MSLRELAYKAADSYRDAQSITVTDFRRDFPIETYFPEPLLRKNLYLSTSAYTLKKSREEGEKDLEALMKNSFREGSWMFDSEEGRWYGMPLNRTFELKINEKSEITLEIGASHLPFPIQSGSWSHYHIHPSFLGPILSFQTDKKQRKAIVFSFPSIEDMRTYCIMALETQNPKALDFRICTPYGHTNLAFLKIPTISDANSYIHSYRVLHNLLIDHELIPFSNLSAEKSVAKSIKMMNKAFKGGISFNVRRLRNHENTKA